jgi:small subunit ribosomal protein S1
MLAEQTAEQTLEHWLTEAYDYEPPRRGQVCKGIILKFDTSGIIVDIGLKLDGLVPQSDIDNLEEEVVSELKLGQEIVTRMVKPGGIDDRHLLSLYQAQQEVDWENAQAMLENNDIWQGEVTGYNRGGVLAKFGQLQVFVPTSHLAVHDRRKLADKKRRDTFEAYIGQEIPLRFIEVNHDSNRLIASERQAKQELQQQKMEELLGTLLEGEVHRGTVRHLAGFGAFVDLGGADGLIHNSELAWRKIRHPSEILRVGDEIDVYILHLDHDRKRISLSLKRLHPDPWTVIGDTLSVDQLVTGVVTNVVDFGVFVALDVGVEGLVHISELADPPPERPQEVTRRGQKLLLRVLRIDPARRRLGLSLKRVSDSERETFGAG